MLKGKVRVQLNCVHLQSKTQQCDIIVITGGNLQRLRIEWEADRKWQMKETQNRQKQKQRQAKLREIACVADNQSIHFRTGQSKVKYRNHSNYGAASIEAEG